MQEEEGNLFRISSKNQGKKCYARVYLEQACGSGGLSAHIVSI